MKKPTLEDYQNMPISSVYLTMVVEKGAKGRIPFAAICPVVRFNHVFVRIDQGKVVNAKKFFLTSTRPISDYYPKGQYEFCIKDGHVGLEFKDSEPYDRYIEYAGKNFDRYVARTVCH